MKTTLLLGVAALLCFASCKNTEEVAKDKIKEKAFDPTEYTAGVIVHSKEKNDCEYTIRLKEGIFYDPVNLDDGFKKDGMAVYFKFMGLRMVNRCTKANPISIKEIIPAKK